MKRLLLFAFPAAFFLSICACAPAQTAAQDNSAVRHADADMHHDKPPVPPSRSLTVSFQGRSVTMSVADLLALPQATVHVHNAHRNVDEEYSGPLVSDILARIGLLASHENEPTILHSTMIATGTDKYFVAYAVAEVEPEFSNGKVIVAVTKGSGPNSEGGSIQLINTGDAKPARWVHGLASLSVEPVARPASR